MSPMPRSDRRFVGFKIDPQQYAEASEVARNEAEDGAEPNLSNVLRRWLTLGSEVDREQRDHR